MSVTFLHFPSDTLRLKMSQLSQDFDTSAFGRRFIFPILQSPDFQLSHCATGPSSLIWLVHYNSFYLLCIVSIIAFCIFSIDAFYIQSLDLQLPHCCVPPPRLPLFDLCCWLVHNDSFYVFFCIGFIGRTLLLNTRCLYFCWNLCLGANMYRMILQLCTFAIQSGDEQRRI